MEDDVRVELQIRAPSKILSSFKTIGELREKFSGLRFVKYIYLDSSDNKLKGTNPKDELPLVENSYITVMGEFKQILPFIKAATSEE